MGVTTAPGAASGVAGPALPGAVLAIDAGNSKTDVALVAGDGTPLAEVRGAGYRPMGEGGAAQAVAGLAPLVAEAAAEAGLPAGPGGPLVEHVSAYLANADLPEEEAEAQALIAGRGWARSVFVGNDTFALLRSGTDRPEGVAVVCGAGVNAVGLRADGATSRFLSIGRISGDWGGGGSLSEDAMFAAVRGEDGRGPETALSGVVARYFGVASATEAAEALHTGRAERSRLWRIVPELFACAEGGDPEALSLVRRQGDEVVGMAVSCLRRLDLVGAPVDVVLGGGVLAARQPLLMAVVRDGLASRAPGARPRFPSDRPVVGAALLGLDRLAGGRTPAAAEARLRGA